MLNFSMHSWPRIGIRGGMWKAQYENFKFRDSAVTGKAVIEINALHYFGMLRNVGNRLISDAVSCLRRRKSLTTALHAQTSSVINGLVLALSVGKVNNFHIVDA